jgi:hypothetical protein
MLEWIIFNKKKNASFNGKGCDDVAENSENPILVYIINMRGACAG